MYKEYRSLGVLRASPPNGKYSVRGVYVRGRVACESAVCCGSPREIGLRILLLLLLRAFRARCLAFRARCLAVASLLPQRYLRGRAARSCLPPVPLKIMHRASWELSTEETANQKKLHRHFLLQSTSLPLPPHHNYTRSGFPAGWDRAASAASSTEEG